jgi:aspartate racemase
MTKKIGILGGLSPESTVEYYLRIVHEYLERFGDHSYPEMVIYSFTFEPYIQWPKSGRWDLVVDGLSQGANHLVDAGVDFIIIATNTMHKVIDEVQANVNIPILSMLDAVSDRIMLEGFRIVGLLGTKFTMQDTFYANTLGSHDIKVVVPSEQDQDYVNRVIYDELIKGVVLDRSKDGFIKIMDRLSEEGAEGIVLGCTEIPMLVGPEDTDIPLLDTTAIHANAALDYALDR